MSYNSRVGRGRSNNYNGNNNNKPQWRERIDSSKITALHVYDFDGTLFLTPTPERGIEYYKSVSGREWPLSGWWSYRQTLEHPFRILPGPALKEFHESKSKENVYTVLLTGRNSGVAHAVKNIMRRHRLYPHRYLFKPDGFRGDTLTFKLRAIHRLLKDFPNVTELRLWEDRDAHVTVFRDLVPKLLDSSMEIAESNYAASQMKPSDKMRITIAELLNQYRESTKSSMTETGEDAEGQQQHANDDDDAEGDDDDVVDEEEGEESPVPGETDAVDDNDYNDDDDDDEGGNAEEQEEDEGELQPEADPNNNNNNNKTMEFVLKTSTTTIPAPDSSSPQQQQQNQEDQGQDQSRQPGIGVGVIDRSTVIINTGNKTVEFAVHHMIATPEEIDRLYVVTKKSGGGGGRGGRGGRGRRGGYSSYRASGRGRGRGGRGRNREEGARHDEEASTVGH